MSTKYIIPENYTVPEIDFTLKNLTDDGISALLDNRE